MNFPSGCFLWRGIFQQFRYFLVPGAFFLPVLYRCPPCFFPVIPIFLSGIFCVLWMPLAVFYQPFRYFFPFSAFPAYGKPPAFLFLYGLSAWNRTRAHSHARNKIWSSLRTFLFLLPQDMPYNTPDLQYFIKYFSKS